MASRILIVDDDEGIVEILEFNLKAEGFVVSTVRSGVEALSLLEHEEVDLILLDVMMPNLSGYKVAETLRTQGNETPIIFLTARDTENDMLTGFSVGADDYISKPFSLKEVSARVKVVLRRASKASIHDSMAIREEYVYDTLTIRPRSKEVFIDGQLVPLTKTETELLLLLVEHPDQVLSRNDIIEVVWRETPYITERTVDVHIARLRKKLGERYAAMLVNRLGYGYKFFPAILDE